MEQLGLMHACDFKLFKLKLFNTYIFILCKTIKQLY